MTPSQQHLLLVERLVGDLKSAILLFALIVCVLTTAMLVDFALGITKAKLAGRKIQSFRLRESAVKVLVYYGSMTMSFLFDVLFVLGDLYETPYLSLLIGAGFVLTEMKSWFEKLGDKEQARIERSAKVIASAITSLSASKVKLSEVVEELGG